MAHNSFSPRYGQYRNPDRSLESDYLADSDGKFKMILGEKRSNLATPLYPILENASLLSSTTSFVSVPTLAVMPINGNANDIITIPSTVTKNIM
jgi:hypothetical protein